MHTVARVGLAGLGTALMLSSGVLAQDSGNDAERLLGVDHYVQVRSRVPATEGDLSQIYVRERTKAGTVLRGVDLAGRVVLFVHGAGTPAEVAFDVPSDGYSWMAHLAAAGFDVFAMDMTGYGRSTRPAPMNDPCNLSPEQQESFVPSLLPAPCEPSYPHALTTIESDWSDLDSVVNYLKGLRNVERVSLVAWSLGGPRVGGYAARHPENVDKLVLLAPAYSRRTRAEPPELPVDGAAMTKQSRADFVALWDRQVGCENQYDPSVRDTVWAEMLASDPVGATWGTGVRRAPRVTTWGWTPDVVARTRTPTLIVAGVHDAQVRADRVRLLYDDLGAEQKVYVDLACASHNAMWERNRTLLFDASLEWLQSGTVGGIGQGVLQLGYED